MKISIVIPIFNEEEVLPELQKRLRIVQNGLGVQNEVIFVDDGSTDNSFALLEEFCRTDSRIKVIQFSRNFGHHIAITAGIDYALGDVVVLMDGDLQNRPEDIHKLLQKMNEGYDIVYTARKDRRDPLFKKIGSFLFLLVMRRIVTDPVAVETSIFRAMNRNVIESFRNLRERNRFVVGLIDWTGFSQSWIDVVHDKRFAGKSKYSFFRQARLALDAIFSFSTFPLHLASMFGFVITFLAFSIGVYIIIRKLIWGLTLPGFGMLSVSIFFIGGVQLIILGIIGAYIGRIYIEVKERPLYIIKRKINYRTANDA